MDIIFDIDGTLADTEHRQWYLEKQPKDWAGFNDAMKYDSVHRDVKFLLEVLWRASTENHILLCTGRSEDDRRITEGWLFDNNIKYTGLYMRPSKDYRDDTVIKKELYYQMVTNGYDPRMVFEDRDKVVKMWRDLGLRCLQVREGNF